MPTQQHKLPTEFEPQLTQGLRIAADQYKEYAEELESIAEQGGSPMITAEAARSLARTHRIQRKQALALMAFFAEADEVLVWTGDTDAVDRLYHPEEHYDDDD